MLFDNAATDARTCRSRYRQHTYITDQRERFAKDLPFQPLPVANDARFTILHCSEPQQDRAHQVRMSDTWAIDSKNQPSSFWFCDSKDLLDLLAK
jgi:hypothetical protein